MQRVAFLVPVFRDGGIERIVENLSKEFCRRHICVDVVVSTGDTARIPAALMLNVAVTELRSMHPYGAWFKFGRYLQEREPDLLIAYQTPSNVLAAAARRLSCTSSLVAANVQVTLSGAAGEAKHKLWARSALYRWISRQVDAIIVPTRGVRADLVSCGVADERLHVLPNPVVGPDTLELARKPLDDEWFNGTRPVIMSAGRLQPQKDFETLLRSIKLLRQRRDVRLALFGEGPLGGQLRRQASNLGIAEHVRFYGFASNVYKYMQRASVFVLSSRWEGFGNVIAEALAVGTPVAATRCPWGPEEILGEGKWGYLAEVGDAESLATAIDAALGTVPDPEDLRARGRQFSAETVVDGYLNLYDSWETQRHR